MKKGFRGTNQGLSTIDFPAALPGFQPTKEERVFPPGAGRFRPVPLNSGRAGAALASGAAVFGKTWINEGNYEHAKNSVEN